MHVPCQAKNVNDSAYVGRECTRATGRESAGVRARAHSKIMGADYCHQR